LTEKSKLLKKVNLFDEKLQLRTKLDFLTCSTPEHGNMRSLLNFSLFSQFISIKTQEITEKSICLTLQLIIVQSLIRGAIQKCGHLVQHFYKNAAITS
jgi:hypothetical protein